ncbi:(2Fe-2S)-binding protein [Acuticoccus sp. MNP-M23]|uniref:(2Fe-2S)-binding protein n=1 Tax=Acuticoccus sp. MNP-M23 TaxID=3072793 RepID=UPI002814A5BE|nr:(2Fe-2S)-binding protein [Acuticoccus sp. MNP-M23]WMS43039.1 (2Fe-2S)-binding protein [Acuticoccus sp. MNP-M23]
MIVCHCNVILRAEVEDAARQILAADPGASLEPQSIYRAIQKRGRCCSCFPSVARIVSELLTQAMNEVDGAAILSASPLKSLVPKDG